MNADMKAKWIAALRSGEYRQTTGVLERLDGKGNVAGNCCLGVLCHVVGAERQPQRDHAYYGGNIATLPTSVAPPLRPCEAMSGRGLKHLESVLTLLAGMVGIFAFLVGFGPN